FLRHGARRQANMHARCRAGCWRDYRCDHRRCRGRNPCSPRRVGHYRLMLVCVGIPTIDGKLHANLVDSLLAETLLGHTQGVHFLVRSEMGCSLIGAARNKLAKWFLDTTQADCLVFVDSDISWPGG